MHYLSQLLGHPGQEFHALDLVRSQDAEVGAEASGFAEPGLPVLDAAAKAAYRRRVADLNEELAEAEQFNDSGRATRSRAELEAITEQLAGAVGLGGRDRQAASATERARSAVTQRIKTAIRRIGVCHPSLADHLSRCIKTGNFCVYEPNPERPILWDF